MERSSVLCGLAVHALRPTGHREASALGCQRDARTTICRGYLSQAHSPVLLFTGNPNSTLELVGLQAFPQDTVSGIFVGRPLRFRSIAQH